MEPANPLLDDYVLGLARVPRPRVLFLPTASGDTLDQMNAFRARFARSRLRRRTAVAVPPARRARSRWRRSCSRRTSSTSAVARCATCSRSGGRTDSTRCCRGVASRHRSRRPQRRRDVLVRRRDHAIRRPAGVDCRHGAAGRIAHRSRRRRARALPGWLASVRDGTLPGGWALDDGVGLLFRGTHPARGRELASGRRGGARGRRRRRAGTPAARRRAAGRRRGLRGAPRREDEAVGSSATSTSCAAASTPSATRLNAPRGLHTWTAGRAQQAPTPGRRLTDSRAAVLPRLRRKAPDVGRFSSGWWRALASRDDRSPGSGQDHADPTLRSRPCAREP